MSQTVVNDVHAPAYEGLLAGAYPHAVETGLANEAGPLHLPVGRLVVKLSGDAGQTAGLGGEGQVSLPNIAADITDAARVRGVSINNPAELELDRAVDFAHYKQDDAVSILRQGRIWVLVEDEIADLDQAVYARHAASGPLTPDTFGTFAAAASANHTIVPAFAWVTLAAAGALALLEVNRP